MTNDRLLTSEDCTDWQIYEKRIRPYLDQQDAKTHRIDMEEFSAQVHAVLDEQNEVRFDEGWNSAIDAIGHALVSAGIILPKPDDKEQADEPNP